MSTESVIELHADQRIRDDLDDMESIHEDVEEEGLGANEPEVKPQQKEEVKNFYYNLDLSVKNIFYSDIYMPEKYLVHAPKQFEYKYMSGTLEQMVEIITKDIEDTNTPKNLIIQCFGKVLLNRTNQSVIEYIYQLINQVDAEGIHKIAPSTNHFIPAKPGSWQHCAHFNAEMRIANIDRGQPPLTLHKALMDREFVDYGPLIIKGSMWQEYVLGEGLGNTLCKAGYKKYLHFIFKAFEHQFRANHHPSKRYIGTPQPPPLSETIGYSDNPRMMRILEEEGLLKVKNYRRTEHVPPQNRFQAVDPPASTKEQSSAPRPVVPQPGRSASSSSLSNAPRHSSEIERPKTWYGQNMVISEEGASRKISLPGVNNDSGVFFEETPKQVKDRIYNEDQDKIDKHNNRATDLRKKLVSWDELEATNESLRRDLKDDENYYKSKIDALIMEKEDLKDKIFDLKEENETLILADELHKSKLRSLQRQLDAKAEECDHKDERIKLVEQQYKFIKSLHNEMGDLFYENNEKDKKKKKSN